MWETSILDTDNVHLIGVKDIKSFILSQSNIVLASFKIFHEPLLTSSDDWMQPLAGWAVVYKNNYQMRNIFDCDKMNDLM